MSLNCHMLPFNRKIPPSTLASHTVKASCPAAPSPASQHIWLLLILSQLVLLGFFFHSDEKSSSALGRHPPDRILLQERDQALLFGLILFHGCATVCRLLWDQCATILPPMESAAPPRPSSGLAPQIPQFPCHRWVQQTSCWLLQCQRIRQSQAGCPWDTCKEKRVNPQLRIQKRSCGSTVLCLPSSQHP